MMTRISILLLSIFLANTVFAQLGGESTYEFLNLPNSARMAALGGNQVAISDSTDLNVSYNNPALLHVDMDNHLLMNYVSYFDDVKFGYASYAKDYGDIGTFALGMHYINYGTFQYAETNGQRNGTFNAAEYALNIIWSKQFGKIRTGATLKPILSSFEAYQSFGVAIDLGAAYVSSDRLTSFGFVLKNIGAQITTYYDNGDRENLPFDMQFGLSKRLAHAPVRLSATMQHLQDWDLQVRFVDEETGELMGEKDGFGKQFMQHLLLGVELLPSENFSVRAGYNYQRRQELMFDDKASTVGFSWGFGFKINRFQFNYGSARYHLAATSNHISVAINLNSDYSRR
ncbi:type IX secretion system protein PorQ [Sunxiuqinia sp. A32]|uniref:type IX secretion system protein PorQ n=1 Tax=Sunxiuqinia sp. A32 TaxID=3461496 RepID=UPI00404591A3